jgi:hypothetical protein
MQSRLGYRLAYGPNRFVHHGDENAPRRICKVTFHDGRSATVLPEDVGSGNV